MKIVSIKSVFINTIMVVAIVFVSCNIEVKKGDAGSIDSNMKSGISIEVIDKLDSVDNENAKELAKMPDTAVQRINRMADSTRTVLKERKKELQKQVEQ